MPSAANSEYLTTQVMTAPPQKLHLMLIEGAIRFAQRGAQEIQGGRREQACEWIIRAQEIVAEMLAGLNKGADADLVQRVASVYLFVQRRLMEAGFLRDQEKLQEAIRLLEIERETWRQLCEQLGFNAPPRTDRMHDSFSAAPPAGQRPAAPHRPHISSPTNDSPAGFSVEA